MKPLYLESIALGFSGDPFQVGSCFHLFKLPDSEDYFIIPELLDTFNVGVVEGFSSEWLNEHCSGKSQYEYWKVHYDT